MIIFVGVQYWTANGRGDADQTACFERVFSGERELTLKKQRRE